MPAMNPVEAAEVVRSAFEKTPLAGKLVSMTAKSGVPLFLTGGFVRDALLCRGETRDIDICLPDDAAAAASEWSSISAGKVVPLDPERGTYRVAGKISGKLWYWDFTSFRGSNITEDLLHRDFTINSMAFDIVPGGAGLMDPAGGLSDLAEGKIRHIDPEAFEDDPIRRLRAYRFAAQLGFEISGETEPHLHGADLFSQVSGERIREELSALLLSVRSAPVIRRIAAGWLLRSLWPGGPDLEGLTLFENFVGTAAEKSGMPEELFLFLESPSTHGLSRRVLLKLLCLAAPNGAPLHARSSETRLRLLEAGRKLILGRKAIRFQVRVLEGLASLYSGPDLFSSPEGPWVYFDSYGDAGLGALALFSAFHGCLEPPSISPAATISFFHHRYLPDLRKKNLITAGEASRITGIPPGPALGDILRRMNMARRLNRITSRKEAIRYLEETTSRDKSR